MMDQAAVHLRILRARTVAPLRMDVEEPSLREGSRDVRSFPISTSWLEYVGRPVSADASTRNRNREVDVSHTHPPSSH